MRVLRFQGVGGASGDMILGALSSVGADMAVIEAELASLGAGAIRIHVSDHAGHGLHGKQVTVHAGDASHAHRGLNAILEMIEASSFSASVRERSAAVFRRIAEVEAEIHSIPVEDVHFHEVGALDAIADVVGGCRALDLLGIEAVSVAPLPIGAGTVTCAHGVYPTPAPATVLLLKGFPTHQTDEPFELVTPTGAALLTTWCAERPAPREGRIVAAGYGFGHRTLNGRPNVLRATVLETDDAGESDECLVLECQVDDTVPELVGALVDRVLQRGALDVFTIPVQMKKQRPGMLITVLCRPDDRESMLDLIFRESTTFGVRESTRRRTVLSRRIERVQTLFGAVRIKIGTWQGRDVTAAPEMDDCIRLAGECGASVREVYEAALALAQGKRK